MFVYLKIKHLWLILRLFSLNLIFNFFMLSCGFLLLSCVEFVILLLKKWFDVLGQLCVTRALHFQILLRPHCLFLSLWGRSHIDLLILCILQPLLCPASCCLILSTVSNLRFTCLSHYLFQLLYFPVLGLSFYLFIFLITPTSLPILFIFEFLEPIHPRFVKVHIW